MQILPVIGFLFGAVWVFTVVVQFNLRTASYVRSIQLISLKQGAEWPFWTDSRRLRAFVFRPETLAADSDSQAMREAKMRLLLHRATLSRQLKVAVTGAIICIFGGLAVGIAVVLSS